MAPTTLWWVAEGASHFIFIILCARLLLLLLLFFDDARNTRLHHPRGTVRKIRGKSVLPKKKKTKGKKIGGKNEKPNKTKLKMRIRGAACWRYVRVCAKCGVCMAAAVMCHAPRTTQPASPHTPQPDRTPIQPEEPAVPHILSRWNFTCARSLKQSASNNSNSSEKKLSSGCKMSAKTFSKLFTRMPFCFFFSLSLSHTHTYSDFFVPLAFCGIIFMWKQSDICWVLYGNGTDWVRGSSGGGGGGGRSKGKGNFRISSRQRRTQFPIELWPDFHLRPPLLAYHALPRPIYIYNIIKQTSQPLPRFKN